MAREKRQPSAGDMVRSLVVILIPILIITFFFTRNLNDHPVTVVDWQPALAQAREESPYPVLAPVNLPGDWRATRVSWTKAGTADPGGTVSARNAWQLGFLDPQDIYIEVRQGDLQPAEFVTAETRSGAVDGQSTVDGERWQRRVSADDRTRSLVLATDKVTTIVVGDTGYEQLEAFAATLESP